MNLKILQPLKINSIIKAFMSEYRDADMIGQTGGEFTGLLQPAAVNALFAAARGIDETDPAVMDFYYAGAQWSLDGKTLIGI